MAKHFSIFIAVPEGISDLVSRLESILALKLNDFDSENQTYNGATVDWNVRVSGHDYENDRDLNFEDFIYEIAFKPIRDPLYAQHEQRTIDYVRTLFERLKALLNCDMMLVENLQKKLAEYRASSDSREKATQS